MSHEEVNTTNKTIDKLGIKVDSIHVWQCLKNLINEQLTICKPISEIGSRAKLIKQPYHVRGICTSFIQWNCADDYQGDA
jgi:hypothetical protein